MKNKKVDVGLYRVKLTVYRTGNVRVSFVNRISGEERTLKVRNPLVFQKRIDSVNYRV
jgi:hypothetical protein